MSELYAHISDDRLRFQTLKAHVEGTAELARKFAEPFHSEDEAYATGILHDIAKASRKFQMRLNGANIRVDHSTGGAIEAKILYKDIYIAACIAGHHAGLPDLGTHFSSDYGDGTLFGRFKARPGKDIEDYSSYKNCISPPVLPSDHIPEWVSRNEAFFYIHMLYSCLVDADYLDTESFMIGKKADRGEYDELETLDIKLSQTISGWQNPTSELNHKRTEILNSLIASAETSPGLYTLTVPTGGGKTVSSMAFALKHAIKNGMKRIIYVIPYQSIIGQTANIFSKIFGEKNVLAHYSNADFWSADDKDEISAGKKLASENWDIPIVVTTSVQFFESFFSNRPSKCRKLHNIANSVIIFDEAQSLPVSVLRPCLSVISELVKHYSCTSVLCTATQPALNRIFSQNDFLPDITIKELCPDTQSLYEYFRRVRYKWEDKVTDDFLVEKIASEKQVLCVVNTIKYAQTLFGRLSGEGLYCLTTLLTPNDRQNQLDEIKKRLITGLPCRVISTSLIEAGVDIDFPTVWREISGLDSIIQAGGRCNRENLRPRDESVVHIFSTENNIPPYIRKNVSAFENTFRKFPDIDSPEAVTAYFTFLLYTLKGDSELDQLNIMKLMTANDLPMKKISEEFKVIDNNDCSIIIPDKDNDDILKELREFGVNRSLIRKLGIYSINIRYDIYEVLKKDGALELISDNLAILSRTDIYDEHIGLNTEKINDLPLLIY